MISSSAANRETNQPSHQAQRAGPRHERAQVRKGKTTGADGVVVGHWGSVFNWVVPSGQLSPKSIQVQYAIY